MSERYASLAALVGAYRCGELSSEVQVILDNDEVFAYDDEVCVFRSHPRHLLEDALDLLSVPWDGA